MPIARRFWRWLCLATLFAGVAVPLRAGPPLITDDPETPGLHGWEVNTSIDVVKTRDLLLVDAPYLDINYGWHENDQLRVQFPLVRFADPITGGPSAGVGDVAFGYKYRFIDEEKCGFGMLTYPELIVPTGNRRLLIGDGDTQLYLPFETGKHWCDERLFVYTEEGFYVCFNDSRQDAWYYGLAAEWKWTKKLTTLGEVGGFVFPNGGAPDDPFFNLGFTYHCNDNVAVMGSAGRSFRDGDTGVPEFTSFLGFQFTWGAEKKEEDKKEGEDKDAEKRAEGAKE